MQSGSLRISRLKITHESRAHPVGDTLMSAGRPPLRHLRSRRSLRSADQSRSFSGRTGEKFSFFFISNRASQSSSGLEDPTQEQSDYLLPNVFTVFFLSGHYIFPLFSQNTCVVMMTTSCSNDSEALRFLLCVCRQMFISIFCPSIC